MSDARVEEVTLWPCDCGVLISHPGTLVRCPNCDASITELGEPVTAYLPKGVRLVGLTEGQIRGLLKGDRARGTMEETLRDNGLERLRSALSAKEGERG